LVKFIESEAARGGGERQPYRRASTVCVAPKKRSLKRARSSMSKTGVMPVEIQLWPESIKARCAPVRRQPVGGGLRHLGAPL